MVFILVFYLLVLYCCAVFLVPGSFFRSVMLCLEDCIHFPSVSAMGERESYGQGMPLCV
jgi:hypothetical protein